MKDYIILINVIMACCCSWLNLDQCFKSCFWEAVKETTTFSSAKSCESVMSNASQIFCREGIVGIKFLRYQDEMVD